MSKERADLGFSDALENFDPAEWKPPKSKPANKRPKKEATSKVAEASGFKSREAQATESLAAPVAPRRRRTGRNAQFNLKARPETIEAYCAIADARGWGLGETLEKAVELLEREYKRRPGEDRSG